MIWNKAKEQVEKRNNDGPQHQNLYQIETVRLRDINTMVACRRDSAAVVKHPPREDKRASSSNGGKVSASVDRGAHDDKPSAKVGAIAL